MRSVVFFLLFCSNLVGAGSMCAHCRLEIVGEPDSCSKCKLKIHPDCSCLPCPSLTVPTTVPTETPANYIPHAILTFSLAAVLGLSWANRNSGVIENVGGSSVQAGAGTGEAIQRGTVLLVDGIQQAGSSIGQGFEQGARRSGRSIAWALILAALLISMSS